MNSLRWIAAVAALALAVPVQAAQNDPEVIIYRVAGVLDSGGAGPTGFATAIFCTNFSGVTETVRIVIRSPSAVVLANLTFPLLHLKTLQVSTKPTNVYGATSLNTGYTGGIGTAAIAATSVNVTCTAMQVDAASLTPIGIALHMTRFNPAPGTEE